MFAHTGLKIKLLSLCVSLALITVVVGGVGYYSSVQTGASYQHVSRTNLPDVQAAAMMHDAFQDVRVVLTSLGAADLTAEEIAQAKAAIQVGIDTYEKQEKIYLDTPFVDGEKELYEATHTEWTSFKAFAARVVRLAESKDPADKAKLSLAVRKDCPAEVAKYDVAIDKLVGFQATEANGWVQKAEATAERGNIIATVIATVGFALALIIGFAFSSGLAKTLNRLAGQLRTGSIEVTKASGQIAEAGTELSASATEQAAALQETVTSLDEINAMVSKNADNAKRSQITSKAGSDAAHGGKRAVDDMVASIEEIDRSNADIMQQIEASNQEIAGIVKVISEIGNKTKVINDIVFQTRLLSFNASVEAARAGEHGKGFAVVAEEVGNLAQMSGNAAKEISSMLESSIRQVEKTVSDTRARVERLVGSGREKIETGLTNSRRCGEALDAIVRSVDELGHMVNEIAAASEEQAAGVREISRAMGQLDQVTQQNAAAAQQAASASEQLNQQAADLNEAVEQLAQTVQGKATGDVAAAATGRVTAPVVEAHRGGHVVPFHAKARPVSKPRLVRAAVGTDLTPSESDPRFKDV